MFATMLIIGLVSTLLCVTILGVILDLMHLLKQVADTIVTPASVLFEGDGIELDTFLADGRDSAQREEEVLDRLERTSAILDATKNHNKQKKVDAANPGETLDTSEKTAEAAKDVSFTIVASTILAEAGCDSAFSALADREGTV
jgi:hypothetical protein